MSLRYRRIDENGDYCFGHGISDFCTDDEAVLQAVATKIKLLRGEWWEDVYSGTELFSKMLGKVNEKTKNEIDILLKERILEVQDVLSIKSFDSGININAKTYGAQVTLETIYGQLEKQIVIGG